MIGTLWSLYTNCDQTVHETIYWSTMTDPYGVAASGIKAYEDITRTEILALAKERISNRHFVSLRGAAGKEVTVVDFHHQGRQFRFEVFNLVDVTRRNPYELSRIPAEVEGNIDQLVQPKPPKEIVRYCMAQGYFNATAAKRKFAWPELHTKVLRMLSRAMERWSALDLERWQQLQNPAIVAAMNELEANWRQRSSCDEKDRFYQRRRDTVATTHSGIMPDVPKASVYWAVDKNWKSLCFHYSRGLQAAYGQPIVNRFIHDVDLYFSVEPPQLPDEQRHPFHEDLLAAKKGLRSGHEN